jgi:hypothetical protein
LAQGLRLFKRYSVASTIPWKMMSPSPGVTMTMRSYRTRNWEPTPNSWILFSISSLADWARVFCTSRMQTTREPGVKEAVLNYGPGHVVALA